MLYGVEMVHIELEAKEPVVYNAANLDHPENLHHENYQGNYFSNLILEGIHT